MNRYSQSRLIWIFWILSLVVPAMAGRKALIIGNGDYKEFPVLSAPLNDADLMRDVFGKLGFTLYVHKDLTITGLNEAFDGFAGEVEAEDEVVVYLSGRGSQIAGENYLLPVNLKAKFKSELQEQTSSLQGLLKKVEGAGASLSVVFLENFQSDGDPLEDNTQVKNSPIRPEFSDPGKKSLRRVHDVFLCFPTAGGTPCETTDGPYSVFTQALASELVRPGQELSKSLSNVRNSVLAMTGNKQQPYVLGSVGRPIIWAEPLRKVIVSYTGSDGVNIRNERNSDLKNNIYGRLFQQTDMPLIQMGDSTSDEGTDWVQLEVTGWVRVRNQGSVFLSEAGANQWKVNQTEDGFVAMRSGKTMTSDTVCEVLTGTVVEELERDMADTHNHFIRAKFRGWAVKKNPYVEYIREFFGK